MNFVDYLSEVLLEGKIDDVLDKHTTIPHDVKQNYLKQVPANNAQHLDWVLQQHTKGNIKPEHNVNSILSTFNKVKDKLPKKQISQYKTVDELHTAVLPHADGVKKSTNEKSTSGTETLYDSPTMTIKQHHNYESTVSAANLPDSNPHHGKAGWCVSVGNGGGAAHHSQYTANGFHPVYTIEHKHPDGSTSRHMLVYDHNKTQSETELRNEADHRPGFTDHQSTRPDLLDHYGKEHSEIMKTPISHLFTEDGREEYKKETLPKQERLAEIFSNIPRTGMSDEEYMHNFKEGQKKQQGGIHNILADNVLSHTQLNHMIENGNEGSKFIIAKRTDLSDDHKRKLANTSNMIVHYNLLQHPNIPDDVFNTIVKKGHSEINKTIIEHPKFSAEHIDTMLARNKDPIDFSSFIQHSGHTLDDTHVEKLLKGGDINTVSSLLRHHSDKIENEHINAIANSGNTESHRALLMNAPKRIDKDHVDSLIKHANNHTLMVDEIPHLLKTEHINTMINRRDETLNRHLLKRIPDQLEPHHIDRLISTGGEDAKDALLARIPHKLDSDHIDALVGGSGLRINKLLAHNPDIKLSHDNINTMISSNHQGLINTVIHSRQNELSHEHIANIIKAGDEYTHEKLLETIPHKLEDSHITNLINNGTSQDQIMLMHKLKDKLDSGHVSDLIREGGIGVVGHLIKHMPEKIMSDHNTDHISEIINQGNKPDIHALMSHMSEKLKPEHINGIINNGDEETNVALMVHLSGKTKDTNGEPLSYSSARQMEPHHITNLINTNNNKVHRVLMSTMPDNLNSAHITSLINKGDDKVKGILLQTLPHKLEPEHIKALFNTNANVHHINYAYSKMSDDAKKEVVRHAQILKNNDDDRWANLPSTHEHLSINKIDKVKQQVIESLDGPIQQIHHNLSDDEINTHIRPIIDKRIKNAEGNAKKSASALVTFASMIDKDQTHKLLSSIGNTNDLPYDYSSKLPTHVRDAVIEHSIKTKNPKLLTSTLNLARHGDDEYLGHHIEHIKTNHPTFMPLVDTKGTHAKEVVDTAIKNNDTQTLNSLSDSYHQKYRSASLDHTISTNNTDKVLSHLYTRDNIPHEDLDKILFNEHKKGYSSERVINAISTLPNLHSRHIDHIIKSGNETAIKNIIGGGYEVPRQNLTKKHVDKIIALKNKGISQHLSNYRNMVTPVQEFNNSKVINESFLMNTTFEKLLKESLISNKLST